jgi:hypothetical protein
MEEDGILNSIDEFTVYNKPSSPPLISCRWKGIILCIVIGECVFLWINNVTIKAKDNFDIQIPMRNKGNPTTGFHSFIEDDNNNTPEDLLVEENVSQPNGVLLDENITCVWSPTSEDTLCIPCIARRIRRTLMTPQRRWLFFGDSTMFRLFQFSPLYSLLYKPSQHPIEIPPSVPSPARVGMPPAVTWLNSCAWIEPRARKKYIVENRTRRYRFALLQPLHHYCKNNI